MLAKDLMSDVIPALKTSDTGQTALNWMELFRISHLPIVNNKDFLGLVSDTDIYDQNISEEPVGNHKLSLFNPSVFENQHIYEVIEIFSRLKLTTLPVLDKNKKYLGLISLTDLLHNFSNISALKNPGSIIVLELNEHDYYLSQITQIIEGNDAKVLSLYITSKPNSTKMEVTIKVNTTDLSRITQTFERYDYTIKETFQENNTVNEILQSRFDSFMNYMNI
ncbi:MAG TPA: hypothetical protein DDX39_04075 [Bacteroidales bacterium]|nr:MAG: hypothetical protein A2W98_09235 [Bacteroidetes bacterium GWF2_33_38]HBF87799.1 hypothetical protein [Bacteroidales bacterium]